MKWSAVWSGSFVGLAVALFASALIGAILSFWDFFGGYSRELSQGVGIMCYAVAGGWSAMKARTSGWLHGAAAAVVFVVFGSVLGFLAFSGPLSAGYLLGKSALAAVIGAAAGILSVNL